MFYGYVYMNIIYIMYMKMFLCYEQRIVAVIVFVFLTISQNAI